MTIPMINQPEYLFYKKTEANGKGEPWPEPIRFKPGLFTKESSFVFRDSSKKHTRVCDI